MKHYRINEFKRNGIKVKRFNANMPESYFKRFQSLAQNQEITMSKLLMKFIDKFDDIKKDNK